MINRFANHNTNALKNGLSRVGRSQFGARRVKSRRIQKKENAK
jgi:hypothetical protein